MSVWIDQFKQGEEFYRLPIIAEIKPHSPCCDDLLRNRNVVDIARSYEKGGAVCISVVTGKWFGGKIEMLSEVAKVTSLPILRKDMIVNLDQIRESVHHGASAVLLTKKLLSISHLTKMIDLCISLDVTPFIEVSNHQELSAVSASSDIIIGITNRDIEQKEMDVDSGFQSLKLIDDAQLLAGAVVSASGIRTVREARGLIRAGFDGLLVGTSLMQSNDPEKAVSHLVWNCALP